MKQNLVQIAPSAHRVILLANCNDLSNHHMFDKEFVGNELGEIVSLDACVEIINPFQKLSPDVRSFLESLKTETNRNPFMVIYDTKLEILKSKKGTDLFKLVNYEFHILFSNKKDLMLFKLIFG